MSAKHGRPVADPVGAADGPATTDIAVAGPPEGDFEARALDLHGHRVIYRAAGTGPPVVLVHGMVNSSRHWKVVAELLAEDYTVIAPDLLGHGESAKPEGDYSLGAHAAGIRDVLAALGIDRATMVGHSLGGGVAMQFFYQFPERCERLILISSGGLGREVSLPLRLAALPGADPVLALLAGPRLIAATDRIATMLRKRIPAASALLRAIARMLGSLGEPPARRAFLHTLRSVIGMGGQRVSARDRLYLLAALPSLIVWGEDDRTIPIEHGLRAHAEAPDSRFATIPRSGHFPHLEEPVALAGILRDFLQTTTPARLEASAWSDLLASKRDAAQS